MGHEKIITLNKSRKLILKKFKIFFILKITNIIFKNQAMKKNSIKNNQENHFSKYQQQNILNIKKKSLKQFKKMHGN